MGITIKNTPKGVSREFVCSWVHATLSVCALHNRPLKGDWVLKTKDLSKRKNAAVPGAGVGAYCSWTDQEIVLGTCMNYPSGAASAIVHELIHACFGDFGHGTNEKCTSTLTAKLIPIIQPIAESMMGDYYRVKAFIAHTKPGMAYPTKSGEADYYDDSQYSVPRKVGVEDSRKRGV